MPKQKWINPSGTATYFAWRSMRSRCYSKNNPSYQHYGGRGIEVCEKWRNDYDAFFNDMSPRPTNHSLDRIDVNKNYSPENCRWATITEQLRNQRRNVKVTAHGETLVLAEWAEKTGISLSTLSKRHTKYGRENEELITVGRLNKWRHGTRQGYEVHKCKCHECRAANTERHRNVRAKKAIKK